MTTITVIGKKVPEIKAVNVQLYKDPDEPIQPPVESKYIERKTAEERRKQAEAKERHTNKLNKAEADRRKNAARIAQRLASEDDGNDDGNEGEDYHQNLADTFDDKIGGNFRLDTRDDREYRNKW